MHFIPPNLILPSIIPWRHDWGRLAWARARGRHGAQERHDWGRLVRARARAGVTVHKNAMIGDDSRGGARAGVTVHKNTMIGDDSRERAPGRHGAQECQKRLNRKTRDFSKKRCVCTTEAGTKFEELS